MATRMDRREILIEIIVTTGAVTITVIMTAGQGVTGIIVMADTEVMAIMEVVADAKVLVGIFVKTKGVTVTGIITTTNTEMAAETEATTEDPPQIIMNPIITGIISTVGVVDDKDFFVEKFLIMP